MAEVIERIITPSTEFTGFLAAPETVELRSRVGGTVEAVSVPEGSMVRKGQMLFQIDPRPFQVALDTATAQLRQAEVLATQAKADLDRAQRLVSTGAVSRKTYDDAVSARSARLAQVQVAKAAVAAMTRTMAVELALDNIRVNAVAPGVTEAAASRTYVDEDPDRDRRAIAMGRRGRPEEQAGAILFLLSDLSSYITGQTLLVDGGLNLKWTHLDADNTSLFLKDESFRAEIKRF